ncbi:MAG: ABC transporter ATP-binding protein [Clostridia bacterium]|nr:ABC transporter ATP-binding protein [Clostridia bacterium]
MHSMSCQNLTASYGSNTVLHPVSFFVDAGEALCILGENGAGKSTLLKCLLRLHHPDGGTIETHGFLPTEIGYLPQQTDTRRDFPASVWEVVLSGCLNMRGFLPFYSKKEKKIATENLKTVGAYDLKNKSFSALSGGQKQRVLLARALCSAKKLLILDEPAAGLDPIAASELLTIIEALKQNGMAIIMVSHDTHSALSVCERVLHLSGQSSFFGTKEEYLASGYARDFLGGAK